MDSAYQLLGENCDIIGLVGLKGVGKDTLADYLCEKYGYVKVAFADTLKVICGEVFGLTYDQLYDPVMKETHDNFWDCTPRKLFQAVGTELFRKELPKHCPGTYDIWPRIVVKKILDMYQNKGLTKFIVTDIRFQNEQEYLEKMGATIVRVDRPDNEYTSNKLSNHSSENTDYVYGTKVSHEVVNDGTVEQLYEKAEKLAKIF